MENITEKQQWPRITDNSGWNTLHSSSDTTLSCCKLVSSWNTTEITYLNPVQNIIDYLWQVKKDPTKAKRASIWSQASQTCPTSDSTYNHLIAEITNYCKYPVDSKALTWVHTNCVGTSVLRKKCDCRIFRLLPHFSVKCAYHIFFRIHWHFLTEF